MKKIRFISPLSWPGGKGKNIKHIIKYFPVKIETFIEPFCGGASLSLKLLEEKRIKKQLVMNDINYDLINFWNCVKQGNITKDYPLNINEIEARAIYEKIPKFGKLGWEFLFQNKLAWCGMERAKFSQTRFKLNYHHCLERVNYCENLLNSIQVDIFNHDYEQIINEYDNENAFFYFDPPYTNVSSAIYKHEKIDYLKLASTLKKIKGKFVLSLNDDNLICDIFKDFNIYKECWIWSMRNAKGKSKLGKELVITNYCVNNEN